VFSKSNFGLTDSIIEASRKVSEDYQEKVKGLMAKMGIKSLRDLSPEEKKKFFNKLDTMHKAKHEEVELDEAKSNFRGKKYAYDSDKHFGGKGTPEQRVQLLKLGNKALKAVPNSPTQNKIQKEMGMSFKEEVELDEAVLRGRDFKYDEKRSRVLITKQNFRKAGRDSTSMSGGIPKMMVLAKNGGTVLAPVEFTDQKKIDAFKEEVELESYNKDAVNKAIKSDPRIKGKEAKMIHSLLKGRTKKKPAKRIVHLDRPDRLTSMRVSKEEAEQVDELKSKTLKSYISKAGKDLSKRVADYHSKDIASSPSKINKRGSSIDKAKSKINKRDLAIDKAKGRLSMNRQLGRAEEVEQVDEMFSDAQIKLLQKKYEPLRGKRVSLDNLKKLDKILDPISGNKKALEKLYKADVPFVSTKASGILIMKHKYKAPDLMKIRGQVESVQVKEMIKFDEGVGEKHQKKIAIDTVKNPKKALLGGMSVSDAEKVLKTKFKFSDAQIKKLKEEVDLEEAKGVIKGFKTNKQKQSYIALAKQVGLKVKDTPNGIELSGKKGDILDLQLATKGDLQTEDIEQVDEKNFGRPNQPDPYRHMGNTPLQRKKVKPGCEEKEIDEISKDLAKSYASKSMKDIAKKQHSTGMTNTSKRFVGLDRAKKRIMKDDLDLEKMAGELDGASKMHKGQSDRIKKHLKKMDSAKTKSERTLTPGEEDKKEKIVMSLKDKAADFEKRYPGKGKQVMYAVATKMAKKD